MATYAELTRQYESLPKNTGDRWRFRQQHEKWWANYQANQTSTGGGADAPWGSAVIDPKATQDAAANPPTTASAPTTPIPEAPGEEDPERPPKPTYAPAPGYEWTWNGTDWIQTRSSQSQARVREELQSILDQFGLGTRDNMTLLEQAVREDWSPTKFLQELRQSPGYLANPLFAANVQRASEGKGFLPEGQVIAYGTEAKALARRFGYKEPSDAYVANAFSKGMSLAEFEHRFRVQERVNLYGGGVSLLYKQLTGDDPSDEDLYGIFDNEISTEEFDRKARQAEYRGRPFTLGLGIRSEAEARALEILGVAPDEAFSRYQGVAQNASRFERLGAIESLISQGLPDDFGKHLMTAENGLLIQALVFQQPDALAKLQDLTAREIARFKTGGGAVSAGGGQQVGLLSGAERQTFG